MKPQIAKELKELLHEPGEPSTKYLTLKDINVTLTSHSTKLFKPIVNAACATWTRNLNKWKTISPELRFEIVKAVLNKKALPLALEFPKFTFEVENIPRKTFDQAVRSRLANYASMGTKDDDMNQLDFVIPSNIYQDDRARAKMTSHFSNTKRLYKELQRMGFPNWCCAHVLPMAMAHRYMFAMDFIALQRFCANRMETTEEESIVYLAWAIRERVKEISPLLADYLRPASDWAKRDMNEAFNGFSEQVGMPHASDTRHLKREDLPKQVNRVKFLEPCTNIAEVEYALSCHFKTSIPGPDQWANYTWETLDSKDRLRFMSE